MPKWLKTLLKSLGALVLLILLLVFGIFLYITYHKDKLLKLVNTELNKQIDGTVSIGDMSPQFFKQFPDVALGLKNVIIRDKQFTRHHHTLLDAKDFSVSVNAADLVKGIIKINHVDINNATIDLFTDSTGYSNTSIFKHQSKKDTTSSSGSSSAQLEKLGLTNVQLKIEDKKAGKLYDFVVNNLNARLSYPDTGWHAAVHLDVTAKSMAFSVSHGSFIKGKAVEGDIDAGFNEKSGKINLFSDALDIGDDPFQINAVLNTSRPGTDFAFHIFAKQLLWRHASSLLSQNITVKLNMFNMAKPIDVHAIISGNFSGGDPFLYITAKVRNNTVSIPGSAIGDCSFDGVFTNNLVPGKGLTDENSVIKLINFKGSYKHIPFQIDTGSIINLTNPIATGNFRTVFPVSDLNELTEGKIARFGKGTASVNLRYRADIVNYRINKPIVRGHIGLQNADIHNLVGNMSLKQTSLNLDFVGNDLVLSNFRIKTGKSIVMLNGRANNILNLYYNSPEKIVLTLNIRSPQMYLAEFIGFLGGDENHSASKRTSNSGDAVTQLSNVFQKGNAEMHLNIDNLHYNKMLATDVHANLLASSGRITIQQVGLKTAGGTLRLDGNIEKGGTLNKVTLNTVVSNVNIHDFFYGFDNFGLSGLTYENLQGELSAKTAITAAINNQASLLPQSINGNVDVSLRNGALLNFKPLISVGKFAFPFRNLKNITIPKLDAHFFVHDEKIDISPLQISSSVLNVDVAGVYGLKNGTDITMDVPLRNPKGDTSITDQAKLQKKRFRGIVLHLRAKADEQGKISIGFNKKKDSE